MHDGVHIRLMVTRGIKVTPYQDPRPGLIGQPFDADDYVNPFEQFMVGN